MKTPKPSRPVQLPTPRKQRGIVRPNEDLETMHDYKRDFPNYTAEQWILEALKINNQHCSDDAIAISNLLYCAMDAITTTTKDN